MNRKNNKAKKLLFELQGEKHSEQRNLLSLGIFMIQAEKLKGAASPIQLFSCVRYQALF